MGYGCFGCHEINGYDGTDREYFYDTDDLDRKPNLPQEFDVDILTKDGEWKLSVGTWAVNKKLNEQHPERQKSLKEIQRLIGLLILGIVVIWCSDQQCVVLGLMWAFLVIVYDHRVNFVFGA